MTGRPCSRLPSIHAAPNSHRSAPWWSSRLALWAHQNGLIPDDAPWADPFSRMRLEEDDPDREPFTMAELRLLFAASVFTKGERPVGGRGDAANSFAS